MSISEANAYKIIKQATYMGLKNILGNQKGSEILFRLKLDILKDIVSDGNFYRDIEDIKSLVSDLAEIIRKYEIETVGAKA
jgi:hypothetical protein